MIFPTFFVTPCCLQSFESNFQNCLTDTKHIDQRYSYIDFGTVIELRTLTINSVKTMERKTENQELTIQC